MPQIREKFSCDRESLVERHVWNEFQECMDEAKFAAYIRNYICPLYPNSRDVSGKRVFIKADSQLGRLIIGLLAKMCANGFILYPVVPNSTAVTQETYRKYSHFKTALRQVLDRVVQQRITKLQRKCLCHCCQHLLVL